MLYYEYLYILKYTLFKNRTARTVPLALKDKVREELERLICNSVLEEIDPSEYSINNHTVMITFYKYIQTWSTIVEHLLPTVMSYVY